MGRLRLGERMNGATVLALLFVLVLSALALAAFWPLLGGVARADGLPDGRVYELVSQPDKRGALIEPIGQEGVIQAAADGGAITYHVDAPTEAEPAGYANEVQVLSVRSGGGWSTKDLAIAHNGATGKSEGVGEDYRLFSEDLSRAVVQPAGAYVPLSPEASEQTTYLRVNFPQGQEGAICPTAAQQSAGESCYLPLVTGAPGFANVPPGTVFGQLGNQGGEIGPCPSHAAVCGPEFEGASADGSHVVLSTISIPVDLTSTHTPTGALYDWSEGKLSLVSELPASEGGVASYQPQLGAHNFNVRNAISRNGQRIIWEGASEQAPNPNEEKHLYLSDTEPEHDETARLDVGLTGTPRFQAASADDSKVFFTDGFTLYECNVVESGGKLTCVLTEIGGELQGGVIGASEDGSYVYFVADSVLAPGATQGTCQQGFSGPEASCSVYVRHDGVTALVATISGADSPDWGIEATPIDLHQMTARVSPNGQWLAFMSQRSLTGYDNVDALSGQRDEEVFLYNDAAPEGEKLHCASCNPTEAQPEGQEYGEKLKLVGGSKVWTNETWLAANVPGWTPYALALARYQSRYLSDSGRLFFNSHDSLVPQDDNKEWDVYELEPAGVGGCTRAGVSFSASAGGCLGLISSGTSASESAFLDASATGGRTVAGAEGGGDVFFLTGEPLLRKDTDTGVDLYDARECAAGVSCSGPAPVVASSCSGEASCKPQALPQPDIFGAPASALASPTGNLTPAPAPALSVKPLSGAQVRKKKLAVELAGALKRCRAKRDRRKRAVCETHARRTYKAANAKSATSKRGKK
jgi:hypothetical protein